MVRDSFYIEDACGESPAASLLRLFSLGEVQIIRPLVAHHSFINRSYSCIMQRSYPRDMLSVQEICYGILGRFLGLLGASWGVFRRSWGLLGGLGKVLGRSWGGLGWSWEVLGRSWGHTGFRETCL